MRNRYEKLLGDGQYSWKKIYIQSTVFACIENVNAHKFSFMKEFCFFKDSDRSLASALLTLAGMFPPNGDEIWNEHIHWQPIPVHTIPAELDHVLAVRKPCDHLDYIMDKYVNSTEYFDTFDKNRPLLDALSTYTGKKIETLHEIMFVESLLFAEISKGFR